MPDHIATPHDSENATCISYVTRLKRCACFKGVYISNSRCDLNQT